MKKNEELPRQDQGTKDEKKIQENRIVDRDAPGDREEAKNLLQQSDLKAKKIDADPKDPSQTP